MKRYLALLALLISPWLHATIHEEAVEYRADSTPLKGYLAWDDAKTGKRPGVHYVRKRARMLAELGYTALAVDMYGDGKHSEHPKEANEFMLAATSQAGVAKQRFLAGKAVLEKHPTVNANKIAAIGYCFGGATVLNMARQGAELAAVVSFHGNLTTHTPTQKGLVKARVLVLNGQDDTFVTAESIEAFNKEMTEAGAHYRFVSKSGGRTWFHESRGR